MLKRLFAVGVASVALVGFMASPATAQQYPPADNSISVSDTTPTPGQTITVTVRTCAPGATVTITLDPDVPLGSGAAGSDGVLTIDVVIPEDTSLGAHTISATCESPTGGTLSLSARIVVVAPSAGAAPPSAGPPTEAPGGGAAGNLPRTGDSLTMPLLRLALALAAVGGVLLALTRRRRRSTAAVPAG